MEYRISKCDSPAVLCKDFIVDEFQVKEARLYGADAALLLAGILSQKQIQLLLDAAKSLGMDVLLEVRDEAELDKALSTSAEIIGVNNRDLKNFSVDINVTKNLLSKISTAKKERRIFVSESGFKAAADISVLPSEVSGILVGEGVVNTPEKISEFVQSRPLVKICGVKTLEIARHCESIGIDMVGLNFVPSSERRVSPLQARELRSALYKTKAAGIFQNQPADEANKIAEELDLDFIQLSGREPLSYVKKLRRPVIKAIPLQTGKDIEKALEYLPHAAYILFDHPDPGQGKLADHGLLKRVDFPYLLAGGLNPANIQPIIAEYLPQGVDTASGVENNRGKSSDLISLFLKLCR